MNSSIVLAGMVSNEEINRALFVLFVVVPGVLIGSIFATVRSRSRIIPIAAGIGAAIGIVASWFNGMYYSSWLDDISVAVMVAAAFSIPGAAVGLIVWSFYFGWRWLTLPDHSDTEVADSREKLRSERSSAMKTSRPLR